MRVGCCQFGLLFLALECIPKQWNLVFLFIFIVHMWKVERGEKNAEIPLRSFELNMTTMIKAVRQWQRMKAKAGYFHTITILDSLDSASLARISFYLWEHNFWLLPLPRKWGKKFLSLLFCVKYLMRIWDTFFFQSEMATTDGAENLCDFRGSQSRQIAFPSFSSRHLSPALQQWNRK